MLPGPMITEALNSVTGDTRLAERLSCLLPRAKVQGQLGSRLAQSTKVDDTADSRFLPGNLTKRCALPGYPFCGTRYRRTCYAGHAMNAIVGGIYAYQRF